MRLMNDSFTISQEKEDAPGGVGGFNLGTTQGLGLVLW